MSVEVERKFTCDPDIEKKLGDIGAVCVGKCQFQDQYFDSPDFGLTLNNVWLRCRQGCWELKCPEKERMQRREESQGETLCTRYMEITVLPQIIAKVREVLKEQHGDQNASVVPLAGKEYNERYTQGEKEGDQSPESSKGNKQKKPVTSPDIKPVTPQQHCVENGCPAPDLAWLTELNLAPFAEYTTERCSFSLTEEGEEGTIHVDLDRADFGYCVGEIEVLVPEGKEVQSALQKIQRTAQRLGLTDDHKIQGKMHVYLERYCPEHYSKLLKANVL